MADDETPRSSAMPPPRPSSAASSSSSVPRAAPLAPLAPHRLAKLANALGVSTPLPAHHVFSASTPNLVTLSNESSAYPLSPGGPRSMDRFARSPTPSSAASSSTAAGFPGLASSSSNTVNQPTSSRLLLHVVPPLDLPHDPESSYLGPSTSSSALAPPPTPGYHPHFRRGVLVPVHPTLPAQLAAIAREYALPSAAGLVLYLVSSNQPARGPNADPNDDEESGPRISDDIWRHIWTRVVRSEAANSASNMPSRAGTPMLGFNLATSPLSTNPPASPWNNRPLTPHSLVSPRPRLAETASAPPPGPASRYPLTPAHSASSSSSESHGRPSMDTDLDIAPERPISTAPTESDVEIDIDLDRQLPGLKSAALIPVLAKVEFVIDRRKATWFGPWLRSRKATQARARSRSRVRVKSEAGDGKEGDEDDVRKPLFELELVHRKENPFAPPRTLDLGDDEEEEQVPVAEEESYAPLDNGEEEEEDPTTRMPLSGKDPLADVFGEDEDAFAEMRSSRPLSGSSRPEVVDLALDAAALSNLPPLEADSTGDTDENENDEEKDVQLEISEVEALWNRQSRPQLSSPPSEPSGSPELGRRRASSTSTSATVRKHIPPPLVLPPPLPTHELGLAPPDTATSTNLAYISGESPSGSGEDPERDREITSPEDKRSGMFYEGIQLGLEESVDDADLFDENDPNDRRKSQYLMQRQLDEIERTLNQFSPRKFTYEEEEERQAATSAANLSMSSSYSQHTVANTSVDTNASSRSIMPTGANAQWPAVPYSQLASPLPNKPLHPALNGGQNKQASADGPPPPRLAINGVTRDIPVVQSSPAAPAPASTSGRQQWSESARRRAQDQHDALYYPLPPNNSPMANRPAVDSPVIPLSPDPFGRFPSATPPPPPLTISRSASVMVDSDPSFYIPSGPPPMPPSAPPTESGRASATPSSRFSTDSLAEDLKAAQQQQGTGAQGAQTQRSQSIVSVKGIKNLWRKSNNTSGSNKSGEPPSPPPVPVTPMSASFDRGDIRPPSAAARASSASGTPTATGTGISGSPPRDPDQRNTARKSILKSWKAHGSSPSLSSTSSPPELSRSSSDGDKSSDKGSDGKGTLEREKRKRRPSLFEAAQSVMRGAGIPPSPNLPEQYMQQQQQAKHGRTQSRTHSRQSSAVSLKPSLRAAPPMPASAPLPTSPLMAAAMVASSSPPREGMSSPRPSYDSSFDMSDFEMVQAGDTSNGTMGGAFNGYVEPR